MPISTIVIVYIDFNINYYLFPKKKNPKTTSLLKIQNRQNEVYLLSYVNIEPSSWFANREVMAVISSKHSGRIMSA